MMRSRTSYSGAVCLLLALSVMAAYSLPVNTAINNHQQSDKHKRDVTSVHRSGSGHARSLVKRQLSLNQDMRALNDYLLEREMERNRQDHANREYLRKLGKRGGGRGSDGVPLTLSPQDVPAAYVVSSEDFFDETDSDLPVYGRDVSSKDLDLPWVKF